MRPVREKLIHPVKFSFNFHYGGSLGFRFSQVESSEFCARIINQRASEGLACAAPVHPDICSFSLKEWDGEDPTGMLAGFPCQARLDGVC